jgi:hypothetical protein
MPLGVELVHENNRVTDIIWTVNALYPNPISRLSPGNTITRCQM